MNQAIRSETRAQDDIEEYYRGDHWDYLDEYEREVALAFDLDYDGVPNQQWKLDYLLDLIYDLPLPEDDWENYKMSTRNDT